MYQCMHQIKHGPNWEFDLIIDYCCFVHRYPPGVDGFRPDAYREMWGQYVTIHNIRQQCTSVFPFSIVFNIMLTTVNSLIYAST